MGLTPNAEEMNENMDLEETPAQNELKMTELQQNNILAMQH